MSTTTPVIALDHPAALDAARVGRKAADLAAARAAGLPVGPGVVLTTEWATEDRPTAGLVWRITSHDGTRPLTVRPSPAGDRRRADAGRATGAVATTTVVHDLEAMLAAIAALRSDDPTAPVLLQPHAVGSWQGVLFADDRAHRLRATSVVAARPAVGGETEEWVAELDRAGRVVDVLTAEQTVGPPAEILRRLARLAERVDASFDGPHDIEWAATDEGPLQLLRVRPVARLRVTNGAGRPRASAPRRNAHRARPRPAAERGSSLVGARLTDESAA
jgi:pyruvate,water dikinase